MSAENRLALRESYMQGWYRMDLDLLLDTTADDFVFDDPAEAAPVTRTDLAGYMQRWDQRMRDLGGDNQWQLTHQLRRDENGLLTDWEWWEVIGTGVQGAAVILTGNDGVIFERITYFDRAIRHPWLNNRELAP